MDKESNVTADPEKGDSWDSEHGSEDGRNTSSPSLSPPTHLTLAEAGNISLDDVKPVRVEIRDLAVTVDTAPSFYSPATYSELLSNKFDTSPQPKQLLHSISADLPPGTVTAIIGGSGSGKTTLLNTLAERVVSSRLAQSGQVLFNAQHGVHSARTAYVMQQDVLIPTLTVRETLQSSADLRLPSSITKSQRRKVVEDVILELGLKECADTRIGNSRHRGCSGGEKRRVSIGVQLLANPSVLFLDEPTTGLDATSAFQLIRTLKSLALKGRNIITTIHQPRSEIWSFFDSLIVLSKGSPVYVGSVPQCIPWFEKRGFPMPPFVNPADHIIDFAAVDNRTPELEEASTARVNELKMVWSAESRARFGTVTAADPGAASSEHKQDRKAVTSHAGFFRQVDVLTRRTLKETIRDPLGMVACIFEAVFMGACMGYIFYDLGRDQAGIRSREGGLYNVAGLQGYLILLFETYRLTVDMPVFDRERSEGCVDVLPFILSRRLARFLPEDLPVPLLFSVIYYFLANFERSAQKFFIFFAITLLTQYIAVMCALVCVAAIRNFAGASLIANLIFTVQALACGMFAQSNHLPVYVRWLKWITYTYYSFGAFAGNEFEGNFYDCPVGGRDDPACVQYTGEFIMESLGFPRNWVVRPIAVLLGFVGLLTTLAYIGLRFLKVEMSIARSRVSEADLSAGKEKMVTRSANEVHAIDVQLQDFSLVLDKRTAKGVRLPRKTILKPVDTTFHAGVLNTILGPSGSGKTSLLNAMALRLRNSVRTQYVSDGKMMFNGASPSETVIRSVCSYVCQDDNALLPSLTVRETLRFSAGLRLPSFMTPEEKTQRAEEILLKMGLKDCADNIVGNDLIKGISGGEKRRVSIAVQILTDPRILLLDEPTSGLDAFTASSILDVLKGLANEGRTVILTIHQARSDLFKHFGNVLLLARGGAPVYAGAGRAMLGYLERQGYPCSRQTNPADFALDLITIDLQHEQKELESTERVNTLIQRWKTRGQSPTAETKSADAGSESVLPGGVPEQLTRTATRKSFQKANLSTPAELGALIRKRASFTTAFPLLVRRSLVNFSRQPDVMVGRIMQVFGYSIVVALFFAPLHHDYYSVQTRVGFIQELGAAYFVGMLQNVAVYPVERDVFYREDDDGVYGVEAFLATYTALELPFEVVSCLLFGVLAAIAVDLPRTATVYFVIVYITFGIVSCGESLGIMFNTLFEHTGFAVNLMGVFLAIANVMAGILSINMPEIFKAFNYLSPIRWAIQAAAPYCLRPVRFTCNDSQRLPDGRCPIETGQQVLELYDLDYDPVVSIGALAACIVVYRLLAWGLLRLARTRWGSLKGT